MLAPQKRPAGIGFKHQIPIVRRNVERRLSDVATGIIDQDVDFAKVAACRLGHGRNALDVANIKLKR
jgi:hypothetical protein